MSTANELAERLAAAYEKLCMTVSLLDLEEIEHGRMADGWTPKAMMGHIAFWDDFQTQRMQAALTGASATEGFRIPAVNNDERAEQDNSRTWTAILAEADAARGRMIAFAQTLDESMLSAEYPEGDRTLSLSALLEHMVRHTRLHTKDLNDYCGSMQRWTQPVLRNFLVTQHQQLMDSISHLTEETIISTVVCGQWTIRDVLVHVLSWNEYVSAVLQQWPDAAHESLTPWLDGNGVDDINAALLVERADLNMIDICDGLMTYHRRILRHFDSVDADELGASGDYGWGEQSTLSNFFYSFALHEAEHAEDIWRYRAQNNTIYPSL